MDLVAQSEEDGKTSTTASTKEPATAAKRENVHNHHSKHKPNKLGNKNITNLPYVTT